MVTDNFFIYLIPQGVQLILTICLIPIFTLYLFPADYGIAAAISIITGLLKALSATGPSWVLNSNYYKINDHERKVLAFNCLLTEILMKSLILVVAFLLGDFLLTKVLKTVSSDYTRYYRIALLTFLFSFTTSTAFSLMVIRKDARYSALTQVTSMITANIAGLVLLCVFGLRTIVLFLMPLVASIVNFIFFAGYLRNKITAKLSLKYLKEILTIGLPALPKTISSYIYRAADKYFIQIFLTSYHLGIYDYSLRFKQVMIPVQKSLSRTILPEIIETADKKKSFDRFYTISKLWLYFMFLASFLMISFGTEIISFLTHGKFRESGRIISVWYLVIFIECYFPFYNSLIFYMKKIKVIIYIFVVIAVINILLIIILILKYEAIGVAFAALISMFLEALLLISYVKRKYKINFNDALYITQFLLLLTYYFVSVYMPMGLKIISFVLVSGIALYNVNIKSLLRDVSLKRFLSRVVSIKKSNNK